MADGKLTNLREVRVVGGKDLRNQSTAPLVLSQVGTHYDERGT